MPAITAVAILLAFIGLNFRAYDGFFQDDELDTLAWAPSRQMTEYVTGFLKPTFDRANFRPVGHLYYTLMGRAFGLDFPPYMTPIFAIHLLNALLLLLLLRKLRIGIWHSLAGVAFFTLSASAFDAYWKPMYVFDLLCATFSLASILLFAYRRWILSFIAFWCAYKSKEPAVMLPAVLLVYEYWFGQRRYLVLIPFFAASLSFGAQGILLNPNKHNEYTFRFTLASLQTTVPFYARRFLFLPFSGLALFALAFVRDRRVWFGLIACVVFLFTLLFLPGRLFEAYTYLPLACAAIAIAAAASHLRPAWVWIALALWMPWNLRDLRHERNAKLALDDEAASFVEQLQSWAAKHPAITTFVYTGLPRSYHHWGVTGAWNIAHNTGGLPALYADWPDATKAMADRTVAFGTWIWNGQTGTLLVRIHLPSR
ncbi:MAG TPA: hypothetical protein VFC21_09915 [Bryobacteraceae bacterium]|nr:hypothetical protein [Bryobacteraceae bacterium]